VTNSHIFQPLINFYISEVHTAHYFTLM